MSLLDLKTTTPLGEPSLDDMIVCGACRLPSVITATGTRLITDAELAELPVEIRDDIRFAKRALDAKLKEN